jgi:hypothetical protein
MRCIVKKTRSIWEDVEPAPCKGAKKETLARKYYRPLIEDKLWVMEIETLSDLASLISDEGHIILSDEKSYKGIDLEIEIYNYYRE